VILPTKGLSEHRALLTIGSEVLESLGGPRSVTAVWTSYADHHRADRERVTFDWFTQALALLYAVGLITITSDGYLSRRRADT
jgi:hypothetical protein